MRYKFGLYLRQLYSVLLSTPKYAALSLLLFFFKLALLPKILAHCIEFLLIKKLLN